LAADSLVNALAAGSPAAFAALYDRLGRQMFRAATALLRVREEAEDAVQDVFVGLARSRERLRRVEDMDSYVFACLRNAVALRVKRQAIERLGFQQVAVARPTIESPPPDCDDSLEAALELLPLEQREVIALKIDGGLTFAQIALVLGISPNTAASRYRYALGRLRKMLEEPNDSRSRAT
jgi:RNA polymerase sigma-70 factor (ECF subfamily)